MTATYDFMFKLLIVGESSVGKTCMLLRFADDVFEDNFLSTIGIDFKVKIIDIDQKKVRLLIWDSAGQERFRYITMSYYRNCSGIIIVYDITSRATFDKISDWIKEVRMHVPDVPLLLVGNKADLEEKREVSFDEGKELADKFHLMFLETSAKTNTNINEAFEELARLLVKDAVANPKPETKNQVRLELASREKQSGGCC